MSKVPAFLLALFTGTLSVAVSAAPIAVSTTGQLALAPDVAVGPKGEIAILWLAKGNPDTQKRRQPRPSGRRVAIPTVHR